MPIEPITLHLIVIKTDKLPEQLAFYSSLGLAFTHHRHGNGPYHYATSSQPVIELYPLPKGIHQLDTTTRLGFTVGALDPLIRQLRDAGVRIISERAVSEWGYCAVVEDIDGRKVELVQAG